MKRLIEGYLCARGVRYFRGHHDDEYFYLVDFAVAAHRGRLNRGRLNVHLEVEQDGVSVSITPDRYYPVGLRGHLDDQIARWNAGRTNLQAMLHASCDPGLVGVLVLGHHRPGDAADLADYVDAAVGASIDLFGATPDVAVLRDAG